MADLPRSLSEFEQRFGDEAACAEYLAAARWPDGFVCPSCAGTKGWRLATEPWMYDCAGCGRQTSVTAGTIMHQSKLPLTNWFWAAYVMATQPNGISALQLQHELGLGSYKSAWLLCAKLRRSTVVPDRTPLSGLVEIDKTEIACRMGNDSLTTRRPSCQGKMLIVVAVEVQDLRVRRARLSALPDPSATSLHAFIAANVAPGANVRTNVAFGYSGAAAINHDHDVIGAMATPWIHRIFSELEVWALGVPRGLHRKHLQSYLDEFVFRFNRRRTRDAAFLSLLGVAAAREPVTYDMLVSPEAAA
jgi:hypothetical protein